MKLKREMVILVLVIAGLSIYLWQRNTDRTRYRLPVLAEVKRAEIERIEITGNEGTIQLERKGESWTIVPQGFPVEADAAARMLDALQTVRLTALVSEAKDYQRYELDPEHRVAVKAMAGGKEVRNLEVGKSASSFRHTFVKLAGDDRVYQADGNFQASFKKSVAELRSKLVLSFDQKDIQELTVTHQGRSLELRRLPLPPAEKPEQGEKPQGSDENPPPLEQWQTADGRPAERAKITELLANLSHLRCTGYLEEKDKNALQQPIYQVKLKGGQDHRLALFDKSAANAGGQPAISSGSDYAFLVPDWKAKDIMQPLEAFLVKEAAADAPSAEGSASAAGAAQESPTVPAEEPASAAPEPVTAPSAATPGSGQ